MENCLNCNTCFLYFSPLLFVKAVDNTFYGIFLIVRTVQYSDRIRQYYECIRNIEKYEYFEYLYEYHGYS